MWNVYAVIMQLPAPAGSCMITQQPFVNYWIHKVIEKEKWGSKGVLKKECAVLWQMITEEPQNLFVHFFSCIGSTQFNQRQM